MKTIDNKKKLEVKMSESALLSLVAARLKGRDLFPEKTEQTRKILQHAKMIKK